MRKSRIVDRCFVVLVLLALLVFLAGVAYSMVDSEPRRGGLSLLLQTVRW